MSQRRSRKVFVAVPVITGVLLLTYATSLWIAEAAPAAAPRPESPVARQEEPAVPPELAALPPPPVIAPRPVVAEAPHAAAPEPPPPAGPSPEVVARATEDAKVQLEYLHAQMVSRCSPAGGGEGSAQLVFHLSFDAQGREVARGVRGRHRARGRELARCLREMQGIELAIQPPGTDVAVAVPVTFP